MTIFFSADFHFRHEKIIGYCSRPFADSKHMDNVIINNINSVVNSNDTLYYLGDFVFGTASDIELYRSRINCRNIHMILGNHDDKIRNLTSLRRLFLTVSDIAYLKISSKKSIVMCHYCMRTWKDKGKGAISLFGHSHGLIKPNNLSMDVGVDNNNFSPFLLDDITKIMRSKSDCR